MTSSTTPPGGPPPTEFRNAISELAKQAREEDRRNEAENKKRAERRPLSPVIKVGAALMVLELVSLGILYGRQRERVTRIAPRIPALSGNDCVGVAHRTYWKIVTYIKDNDRPPAKLGDLIPKYVDKLPFDQATGKPLEYSTDGKRFDLRCPGPTARK